MAFLKKTVLSGKNEQETDFKEKYLHISKKYAKLLGKYAHIQEVLDFCMDELGPQEVDRLLKAKKSNHNSNESEN